MALHDLFSALGDPVRLELIERLSVSPRQSISVVTTNLGLTRQGARRHLQVLADANLVNLQPSGRDVWVELNFAHLQLAKLFIAKLEQQWDEKLSKLKIAVENENQ